MGKLGLWFMWFYVREQVKAQLAGVLVLKYLRRWGHSLKTHPTDWESRGSNLGPLGTRRVTYPLPLHHCGSLFVTVPWKPVVFMFCGLISGAPKGLAGSGSGLKCLSIIDGATAESLTRETGRRGTIIGMF